MTDHLIPIFIVINHSRHRTCPCFSVWRSRPNRSTRPSGVSPLLLQHTTLPLSPVMTRESVQCVWVWLPGTRVLVFFFVVLGGLPPQRFLKHRIEGDPCHVPGGRVRDRTSGGRVRDISREDVLFILTLHRSCRSCTRRSLNRTLRCVYTKMNGFHRLTCNTHDMTRQCFPQNWEVQVPSSSLFSSE